MFIMLSQELLEYSSWLSTAVRYHRSGAHCSHVWVDTPEPPRLTVRSPSGRNCCHINAKETTLYICIYLYEVVGVQRTTLQRTTLQRTTLHHTKLRRTTLQRTTLHPTTLQSTTVQRTTLQRIALQRTALQRTYYSAFNCNTLHYSTL